MRLGPYDLDRPIGRGAMGEVWSALHRDSGERHALKIVRREKADERFEEAFRSEVRAAAAVRHPGVAQVYDVGTVHAPPLGPASFVVLELAEASLAARPPTDWPRARDVLLQILDGLGAAHARGIVHRDVKPANILCFAGGRVALADFGVAVLPGDRAGGVLGSRAGTPAFQAPEHAAGRWREVGPWTDLFSVGRIALGLNVPSPPGFDAWLRAMLAPDPACRFRCAADAAEALRGLTGEPVAAVAAAAWTGAETTCDVDELPAIAEVTASVDEAPPPAPFPDTWPTLPSPAATWAIAGLGLFDVREPPLAGRAREREQLWSALSAVRAQRRARAVVVTGPNGIGKTRLVAELARVAHTAGAATYAIAPDLRSLAAALLGCDGLTGAALAAHVADRLAGADEPETTAHALAGLVGGGPEDDPAARAALLRLFAYLARERPLIVGVDDAPRCPAAVPLAAEIAACGAPVLMVLTADTEDLAALPALGRVPALAVHLEALDGAEVMELLHALLPLSATVAWGIAHRAAGNPQFAVLLLRDLVRNDALAPQRHGFDLRPDAPAPQPPSGLREAWAGRLAPFLADPGQRLALEVAALLGRQFGSDAWHEVCARLGAAVDPALVESLAVAGLIRRGPGGYTFAHPAVREALLASGSARAAERHEAALHVLPEAQRAEHLFGTGRWAEALPALERAAKEASVRLDAAEMSRLVALYARAVEASGAPVGSDPSVERHILAAICDRITERLDRAEAAALQAVHEGGGGVRHTEALFELGRIRITSGNAAGAAEAFAEVAERAETPRRALLARMFQVNALGNGEDPARAVALGEAELENVETDSDRAMSHTLVANAYQVLGQLDDAERHARAGMAIGERLGNASARSDAMLVLGMTLTEIGRLDEAEALLLEVARIRRQRGSETLDADVGRAAVLVRRGAWRDARALLDALCETFAVRTPRRVAELGPLRVAAAAGAGDWETVERLLPELPRADRHADRRSVASAAEAASAAGRTELARRLAAWVGGGAVPTDDLLPVNRSLTDS